MFIRTSALFLPALGLFSVVAAAPESLAADDTCSNGTLQCCGETYDATQNNLNFLTGLLGIAGNIPLVGPLLALNCSPITVIGVGSGANCAQQAVCCQNTQYNGLINVGCTPINLGV